MHKVKLEEKNIRSDLITECEIEKEKGKRKEEQTEKNGIKIIKTNIEKEKYTTITFEDITDKASFEEIQKVLIEELKEYISYQKNKKYLIIGLGNEKSTPDALGPKTIENILVTRYLFLIGDVEEGYSNVAVYAPSVIGNTGVESVSLIKSLIKDLEPDMVILIDALKASSLKRLVKTIQLTNSGIHPGSGIQNDRGEISKKTMGCEVLAIGVPTVVDINTIRNTQKEQLEDNFIVTPTNIDFVIERLSYLIGNSLNKILHKNYSTTNKK